MGLIDFVKSAGEKLFGNSKEEDSKRAQKLESYVSKLGFSVHGLDIEVDGEKASIAGKTSSQEEREKIVLAVGNTEGISEVDDNMTVATKGKADAAAYYTVKRGDTLSEIAKQHYGDAMLYPVIFEANRPMLSDPDKIYPGQVLRIPPKAA